MTINLSMPEIRELRPRITVIGIGGAGGNAVNNMINANLEGVEFVVGNTDAQALSQSLTERRIQFGVNITHGLGAGSRPDVGRAAAEEALDQIVEALDGSHMAFITAGMGGGTGTGAAPVIAQVAREKGILTVGVITKPFQFEGAHRMEIAEAGIEELQSQVDTLIIIPNQNLFRVANEKTTFAEAFKMADDVLHAGVRGVTDLMVMPGLINLDFADVRAVMSEMGKAMMGTGEAEGEKRALDSAEAAISNPLLDDVSMKGARGVLINITGGMDMTLFEVDEAANRIRDEVDVDANIIFGSTFDESLEGRMRVSVVATGIDADEMAAERPQAFPAAAFHPRKLGEGGSRLALAAVAGTALAAETAEPDEAPGRGEGPPSRPTAAIAGGGAAAARVLEASPEPEPEPMAAQRELLELTDVVAEGRSPEPTLQGAAAAAPARAMGDGGERSFIPPKPMEPATRRDATGRPEPFAEAAVANGTRGFGRRKSAAGLFERITRGRVRPSDEGDRAAAPVSEPEAEKPSEPSAEAEERELIEERTDDDLLDIPAFLRRQAN